METKKCSKCQEDIQISAKKCKHCGADLNNWFMRHKILTFILIIIIIGAISNSLKGDKNDSDSSNSTSVNSNTTEKENEVEVQKETSIKITSIDLFNQYEENEIKADEQYKNKLLEISGVIEGIGKDFLDNPFVTLKTDDLFMTVQCMLADSEKSKAAELSSGQSIVMEGKNSGKIVGIVLNNCIIK